MRGLDAIEAMFAQAQQANRAAFLPYFPMGYPTYDESLAAIEQMAKADVDGFEIGIPFSDPLADGPTIQAATQIALEQGMTVRRCIEGVVALRARGVQQPMLLMGYLNPLLAYGLEQYVMDAKAAGADGFIVPDLPPDEAHVMTALCAREGLALVFFATPTSNDARLKLVGEQATGFIYCVSLTGVTGARAALPPDLTAFIERVRLHTRQPLVIGFGIGTPEQARQVNTLAEGFIVGSALVKAAADGVDSVGQLAESLRRALD